MAGYHPPRNRVNADLGGSRKAGCVGDAEGLRGDFPGNSDTSPFGTFPPGGCPQVSLLPGTRTWLARKIAPVTRDDRRAFPGCISGASCAIMGLYSLPVEE